MGLKSFFQKYAAQRDEKRKYKALVFAIKAGDAAGVRAALEAGATAGYYRGVEELMPLSVALAMNNAEIFGILLDTPSGRDAARYQHPLSREVENVGNVTTYFKPSFLYRAIELGYSDIALMLVKNPDIPPSQSGQFFSGNAPYFGDYYKVASPLELARSKGMTAVAAALEERLAPQLAEQAEKKAEDLEQLAAQKRAEAEQLQAEAERLAPHRKQPVQPRKLNV